MTCYTIKLAGAAVLVVMGGLSLRGRHAAASERDRDDRRSRSDLAGLRDGLLTSRQPEAGRVLRRAVSAVRAPRCSGLPAALVMAGVIVTFDLVWYSTLALIVNRAKRAFVEGPWSRRLERLTGAVLVGLGVRLALERP
jgi:threonine/homoserine/homoserine lactone efflux protein